MNWRFEDGRIYSADDNNELLAEVTFVTKKNGEVDIDHTYVNPILRGQGIAGKLMEAVVGYLREKNLKATASCSFASAWLTKNRELYADIISNDFCGDAPACKIEGKH